MTAPASLTVTDLNEILGTDGRTTRKFLRSITPKDDQPGKGSRWGLEGGAKNITALKKQFAAFQAAAAEKAAKADADTAE